MDKILISVAITLLVGAGAFYGGMRYAQSKTSEAFPQAGFQALRDLSQEEREQRIQEMGAANLGGADMSFVLNRTGSRAGSGLAVGEIISKDAESFTIKLQDGGSKIVFYSESTEVSKFVSGSPDEFELGQSIVASGEANEDGSITAKAIQLRPEMLGQPESADQ